MVLSVVAGTFAFAGTAAAGVDSANTSVVSEAQPGETVTVTTTVDMDGDGGDLSVAGDFSPAFQSASNLQVTVDGSDVSPSLGFVNSNGLSVVLEDLDADANVEVTYDVTVVDTEGATHDIETNVNDGAAVETDSVSVAGGSTTNDNFQVSNLSPTDVTVEQGSQIDVEATVTNTGTASGTQDVEFRVGGSAVATQNNIQLDAGESQIVTFSSVDTSGLSTGSYIHGVFTDDDSQTATLTITEDVSLTEPEVSSATEDQGELTISFNTPSEYVINDETYDLQDPPADNVTIYYRAPGTGDFDDLTIDEVDTPLEGDDDTLVIPESVHGFGDLSPAGEVKVDVGTLRSTAATDDSFDNNIGNVTVRTSSERIVIDDTEHQSRSDAELIYQGSPILIQGESERTNVRIRRVDSSQLLLDGSTARDSQLIYDSNNLEVGSYKVIFNEDDGVAGNEDVQFFNVTQLGLEATLEEDGTLFDHDEDVELNIDGSATRGRSEREVPSVAIDVLGPDNRYELADYNGAGEFSANPNYETDLDAGDYTVTVIDVRTGVSVTAGEFSVDDFPDADNVQFGASPNEDRGDVVEIPLNLDESEEGALATVAIGSRDQTNYVTNVTVADEDGDGEVVLEFNTYLAGISAAADNRDTPNDGEMARARDRIFSTEDPDDSVQSWRGENGSYVTALRNASLNIGDDGVDLDDDDANEVIDNVNTTAKLATLDAASYELTAVANDEEDDLDVFNFTDDGSDYDDVSTLNLRTRATESSTVWVAPQGRAAVIDFNYINEDILDDNVDEIDENLTQADLAASEEVVLHQISATGVEGVLRNRTDAGENVTSAYLQELNNSDQEPRYPLFTSAFREDNPGPNEPREFFELDTSNTDVIPDYQNDTYYVVVDLADIDSDKLGAEGDQDTQRWRAQFGWEEYPAVGPILGGEGGGEVSSLWSFYEADAELQTDQNGRVVLRNLDGQTVSGATNVAPGTELEIRVQSRADDGAFFETLDVRSNQTDTAETTSGLPYSFEETTDVFANKNSGINFTAWVVRQNRISDRYDGRMLGTPTAQVSLSDQQVTEERQEVLVDSVSLSDGGFVAIHAGNASGPVIGHSQRLDAGTTENVRIDLDEPISTTTTLVAMPHLDTDDDNVYEFPERDGPYTADGAPVTDSAEVDVGTPTPTPTMTPTPTPTPTETPTPSPTPTTMDGMDTDTPTDGDGSTPEPTTTATGPGFGLVVSLIALLAAALIAVRRRD